MDRFINSLGIRHIGEETARDLAAAFGTFEKFCNATKEELTAIDGVGEVAADSIVEFFADSHEARRLYNLLETVTVMHAAKKAAGKLSGTSWVLTGALGSLSREEAKAAIRERGGEVSESVSKNTTYLVAGADPGSKFDKAKKLGVRIIDEEKLRDILK